MLGSAFPGTLADEVTFVGPTGPEGRPLLGTPMSDAPLPEESQTPWGCSASSLQQREPGGGIWGGSSAAVLGATSSLHRWVWVVLYPHSRMKKSQWRQSGGSAKRGGLVLKGGAFNLHSFVRCPRTGRSGHCRVTVPRNICSSRGLPRLGVRRGG